LAGEPSAAGREGAGRLAVDLRIHLGDFRQRQARPGKLLLGGGVQGQHCRGLCRERHRRLHRDLFGPGRHQPRQRWQRRGARTQGAAGDIDQLRSDRRGARID